MEKSIKLKADWLALLKEEFEQDYFKQIKSFILVEHKKGKNIFPPADLIFNAFDNCPLDKLKVIILGQDPYHGPGQAHGLSFSVPKSVRQPPSLVNIFKEIELDLGINKPEHGNLVSWAKQGVLLLNAFLTVNAHEPGSHKNSGWDQFTDAVIKRISLHNQHLVFMLWGRFAQQKTTLIDSDKHLILRAAHPSPFSADKGFFGCKHFSKANKYLEKHQKSIIDWNLLQ